MNYRQNIDTYYSVVKIQLPIGEYLQFYVSGLLHHPHCIATVHSMAICTNGDWQFANI